MIAQFLNLSRSQRLIIINSFAISLLIKIIFFLPYKNFKLFLKLNIKSKYNHEDFNILELERLHNKVINKLKIKSCLASSASLKLLLQKYGYNPKIFYGVKLDEQKNIDGHAWVEVEKHKIKSSETKKNYISYTSY